jgi:photosystem II stability/assembly factor-like uncharacterized protein
MVGLRLVGWMLASTAIPVAGSPGANGAAPDSASSEVRPDLIGGREVNTGDSRVLLVWGTGAALLRSGEGREWQRVRTRGSADLAQVAANDTGTVLVAVGARGSLLRSTDAGRTWSARRAPSTEVDLTTVTWAGNRIWLAAGTGGQIWRSIDDAQTWRVVKSPLAATLRTLNRDATTGRVLLGGDEGIAGYSQDLGETWQVTLLEMPDPPTSITSIHRFGELLLATSGRGRFLISGNGADSWDLLQSISPADITGAAHHPARGLILLTAANGDVVRSRDGGREWEVGEAALHGERIHLRALRFDDDTNTFVALAQDGAVVHSRDGDQWERKFQAPRGELRGFFVDSRGAVIAYGANGLLAVADDSDGGWIYSPLGDDHPP